MVAEVVARFGSEAQRREHVPGLVSGAYVAGAFALSEPQAGSDPGAMRTVAERTATGYRLSGAKQWITSGDRAGLTVVWAKTDAAAGTRGISAFLVRAGTHGFSAGRHEDKMGLRGSTTVPLLLDGVELPREALLGEEGMGFRIAMMALDGGRIGIASQALGVGRAAISAAAAHLRAGHTDAEQGLTFRLADAAMEMAAARLLTRRAAWLKEQGAAFTREASMAKLYASESAGRACDAAVQILGEAGYGGELPVERFGRDARVQRIYEGTSEIQRIVIARSLLAEGVRS
jgi:alkylation response protein AidB-like acyl-CoA dehydrogenase